ncbi:MAG: hypothetical protein IJ644_08955 [Oscillospiraceae bacterium]|nr:hypothetical protein [Oscillospiraceae bacterium]
MKVRKIAAAMAAVSMLATISAQSVFAADSVTVSADKVEAKAGSEFTLAVKLSGVPAAGISGAEFELTYDASALTITGASAGDIVNTSASAQEGFDGVTVFDADYSVAGTVTVTYGVALDDTAYWVTQDGTFLTLTGKVNDGVADGTYDVAIKGISRETYEGSGTPNTEIYIGNMASDGTITNYSVTAAAGAVVVGSEPTTATLMGDADLDGSVNILDVITINKAILGKEELTKQGLINADINKDGKPDSTDALNIMKAIVGLITLE